jgi:hypothetical protein
MEALLKKKKRGSKQDETEFPTKEMVHVWSFTPY